MVHNNLPKMFLIFNHNYFVFLRMIRPETNILAILHLTDIMSHYTRGWISPITVIFSLGY